jgi:hypothetical protein
MDPKRALRRRTALTAIMVVALAACSKGATPGAGDLAQGPSGSRPTLAPPDPAGGGVGASGGSGSGGSQGNGSGGTNDSGASGSGGSSSQGATTDDLRVFGYATVDEGQLAGEVSLVAATVTQLSSDAAARNMDAAKADAATLLQEARTLETDANNATKRQQPLAPTDPTLVTARADAIDAFGLTADYASTVGDLANAALDLNLSELLSVAQQAASLAGTSAQLESAFEDLNHELTSWAQDHPGDAAKALAQYDK